MSRPQKIFLLLDYDGTLTPIVQRPDLAVLSAERKTILRRLAERSNLKVAIISGRRLSNVKKLVGIRNVIYAGNHGFEIAACAKRWAHPAAIQLAPELKQIKRALRNALRLRGAVIEDKGLTLSVHYRLLPKKALPEFKKLFARALKPWAKAVKITRGKKVFEVRPPVDWDKGKAVKWLIKSLRLLKYRPVYLGDDQTDEAAFRVLRKKGLTVRVGRGKTLANQRVKNSGEVFHYLRGLIKDAS